MYTLIQVIKKKILISNRIWDMVNFLFPRWINSLNVLFLRKTNTFIKSKYSKNRQWSKSIVYFGLWFGVICAFTFTYYNYRFLFTLSYLWWCGYVIILLAATVLIKKYWRHNTLGFLNCFF